MQQDAACGLPARRLQPAAARSLLQPAACGLQQPQRGVLHAALCMQHCYSSVAATGPPHGGCSRGSSFAAVALQHAAERTLMKDQ